MNKFLTPFQILVVAALIIATIITSSIGVYYTDEVKSAFAAAVAFGVSITLFFTAMRLHSRWGLDKSEVMNGVGVLGFIGIATVPFFS